MTFSAEESFSYTINEIQNLSTLSWGGELPWEIVFHRTFQLISNSLIFLGILLS